MSGGKDCARKPGHRCIAYADDCEVDRGYKCCGVMKCVQQTWVPPGERFICVYT